MAQFRVWAKAIDYCYLDVEANDEDEAFAIAAETDGGEFITEDCSGDWQLIDAEEIK